MGMIRGTIGGVVAGAIGAAIWAAIAHFANAEVGYVAWGIGFLVGFGVRLMAGDSQGAGLGVLAALLAVLSIVGGKYAAAGMHLEKALQERTPSATAESLVVGIADRICEEREARGEKVAFAPGMDSQKANQQQDYPADVWAEAKAEWDALTPEQQQERKTSHDAAVKVLMQQMVGALKMEVFKRSFGPFDLLWCLLAVSTAYRLGAGGE